MRRRAISACAYLLTCLTGYAPAGPAAGRPDSHAPANPIVALTAEPARLMLTGPRAEARVVITARRADGSLEDVTAQTTLLSDDPRTIRTGADHVLQPVADGETTVRARCGSAETRIPVLVKEAGKPATIDFTREIVPIFSRAGCSLGACHGSQYGKGGFKLSLAGSDPDVDYAALTHQAGGRRVCKVDPARSLFLQKPTLAVAHMGGRRLEIGSTDYRLLIEWLRDGAPGPTPRDAEVIRLDIFPAARVMRPKANQALAVYAAYSDGVVRDVTRWARLDSLNDSVARLSPDAVVTAAGPGETAVRVRFGGQAAVSRITVPYRQIAKFPILPRNNYVDPLVESKWRALGIPPSGLCDDATFIRRVSLDVIGTPPTPEEAQAFLADRDPKKREKLIDRLLERPEYADYWALKWGDLLRSERMRLGPKGMWSFSNWIRAQFRDNRPFDAFCRDLITAQGSTYTNGPANYYRVVSSPPELAETTAQVFLGTRMQCAHCHHHPYERWSQADYYRLAAYFARVGLKGSEEFGIYGNEQVVKLNDGGEVTHPKTGQVLKPAPLGGYPDSMRVRDTKTSALIDPDADAGGDRRKLLADWITHDNLFFARNVANRYWGYLMGRGLVEPIDDQRVTNPPTNPDLLDALARDFMAHQYDVKHLIRTICASRAYQLSADVTKQNAGDQMFYSHYLVKRLPAEVLFDAINFATGTQEKFPGLPLGYRAIQLPDSGVDSYFLDTFGRARRVIACECERTAEPNVGQALHLMMGDLVNRKVQDTKGTVAALIADKKTDSEILTALYLRALSRPPTSEELSKATEQIRATVERPLILQAPRPVPPLPAIVPRLPALTEPLTLTLPRTPQAKARERKAVIEDVLWALLNSKEFMCNH